jgi:hypothetical protein
MVEPLSPVATVPHGVPPSVRGGFMCTSLAPIAVKAVNLGAPSGV